MAIVATNSGGGQKFEPAPTGVHVAVCVDVIDMGMLEVTWNKQKKMQHKIRIAWQIGEDRDDGKPFLVQKRYTLSLSEKANLRADLESWRGVPFSEAQLAGFDVEKLIGVNCLLNVVQEKKGTETYANVKAIMPLAKGMVKMVQRDYVRVIDRTPEDHQAASEQGEQTEPFGTITDDDVPF